MILYIKNSTFITLICIGIYIFYSEYKKITNLNLNYTSDQFYEQSNKYQDEINSISKKDLIKKNDNEIAKIKLNKIETIISKGDTFLSILKKYDFSDPIIFEIINKIKEYYDLKKLKVDDKIFFYKNENEKIKKIQINLDIDTVLIVNIDNFISIEKKDLEKNFHEISNEFVIYQSLYTDGLKNSIPQEILVKLIKLFSFDLDFQRDIKKNTVVSISYDFNQINENNKIEYKDINYALISIEGKKLEYFKFVTDDGFVDYFNKDGKNVKKSILKTPLDGARISSNYGMRKHPISGFNKMHKGVDFAAPKGTPIYAGGNGIIEYVGNNGGYGKYIRIRHNNEYKTAYAHLSSFKKGISKGVRVNQGDIIGYVGSTGNSTGPHLHYEILFQNKHINPLKLKLPSGKILEGIELERFKQEYKKIYANHLNLLYE